MNPIECPQCGGELHMHTQCPRPFYFCAEQLCTFRIDARDVRVVPTSFELELLATNI